MKKERIYEDLSLIQKRANVIFIAIALIFFLILAYYWKVQIIEHNKYLKIAENNRTRLRLISAPRGIIRDRNGQVLADNQAAFKILLLRENVRDYEKLKEEISQYLNIDPDTLEERINKHKNVPWHEPIVIKDRLTLEEAAPAAVRFMDYPELLAEAEPQRVYPRGSLAAHVLGYLQERTADEIRSDRKGRLRLGDLGGKAGVEKKYDGILTGENGLLTEIVDSSGRSRGEINRINPVQGKSINLTIDTDLQLLAENLLGAREGAIIVLDPNSGEILTLASSPTFDPNKFITRFAPSEWQNLVQDQASPFENRAIRGLYAPGSIFKLVLAMAGLHKGLINENSTVFCSGSTIIYGITFRCWFEAGHGRQNLTEAIRNSCNIYFYDLGRRLGVDNIAQIAQQFGLGARTGIDLPDEREGLVPTTDWKRTFQNQPWYPGETMPVSIGQGPLLVTPLQVAKLTEIIANRGRCVVPRVVNEKYDNNLEAGGINHGLIESGAVFQAKEFEKIIEGMWRSVNAGGTGQGARVEGLDICGKTGSTQIISRETAQRLAKLGKAIKTHSWFSGFAPRNNPRLVVTVLVEYGGSGGAIAAPIAGKLFEYYFQKNKSNK